MEKKLIVSIKYINQRFKNLAYPLFLIENKI